MMSNDELAVLILEWARDNMPEAYEQTLTRAARPAAFRNFLVRLIERRYERDAEWRTTVPLRALEETGITARLRASDGTVIEVKGKRAEGERVWSFAELAMMLEAGSELSDMIRLKEQLDLIIAEGGR
jgi:hypothetical protein